MVIALNGNQGEMQLLTRAQVQSWSDASPFILSGHRPERRSWVYWLASWAYCHNESANIYSHLVPGLLLILLATVYWDLRGIDGL
jgi:adiponectin receptor